MKPITISIVIASLLIVIALFFGKYIVRSSVDAPINNVHVVDGKQIIEISAKGGYWPKTSTAKSGIPTVLRFNTNGTFDCSSSVRIPSLNIGRQLSQTGSTDIDIGEQSGALRGTCGMGMYPFEIRFI